MAKTNLDTALDWILASSDHTKAFRADYSVIERAIPGLSAADHAVLRSVHQKGMAAPEMQSEVAGQRSYGWEEN